MKYFTFSLDDGYESWLNAARILEKHGWRGTFNVCLRNVANERLATRQRMFPPSDVLTWSEVRWLQNAGHEIASHGVRHTDLSGATKEELELEMASSKRVFTSRGIRVDTYACQFNNYTSEADAVSRQHYRTIRGLTGVNTTPFTGRIYRALRGDLAVDAVSDGKWVVGIWHNITPEKFALDVERVAKSGAIVKTVREMTA